MDHHEILIHDDNAIDVSVITPTAVVILDSGVHNNNTVDEQVNRQTISTTTTTTVLSTKNDSEYDINIIENQLKYMYIDHRKRRRQNKLSHPIGTFRKSSIRYDNNNGDMKTNKCVSSTNNSTNPFIIKDKCLKNKQPYNQKNKCLSSKMTIKIRKNPDIGLINNKKVILFNNDDDDDDDEQIQVALSNIHHKHENVDVLINQNKNNNWLMVSINEKMASLWSKDGYRTKTQTRKSPTAIKLLIHPRKRDKKKFRSSGLLDFVGSEQLYGDGQSGQSCSLSSNLSSQSQTSCAQQASLYDQHQQCDSSAIVELAAYFEETLFIPKKMSFMAEMMYT